MNPDEKRISRRFVEKRHMLFSITFGKNISEYSSTMKSLNFIATLQSIIVNPSAIMHAKFSDVQTHYGFKIILHGFKNKSVK